MDALSILEEKIKLLVQHIQKLQLEKFDILKAQEALEKSNENLKVEIEQLVEENFQLQEQVKEAQVVSTKGIKQLDTLAKERELTKNAVDELIKSIDGLIYNSEVSQ